MSWDALSNAAQAIAGMIQNQKSKQQQQAQFDTQMQQQNSRWQQNFDLNKTNSAVQQQLYELQMQKMQYDLDNAKQGSLVEFSSPYGSIQLSPFKADGTKKTTTELKTEYEQEKAKLYQEKQQSIWLQGQGTGSNSSNSSFKLPDNTYYSAVLQKASNTLKPDVINSKYDTPEKMNQFINDYMVLVQQGAQGLNPNSNTYQTDISALKIAATNYLKSIGINVDLANAKPSQTQTTQPPASSSSLNVVDMSKAQQTSQINYLQNEINKAEDAKKYSTSQSQLDGLNNSIESMKKLLDELLKQQSSNSGM